MMGWDKIAAGAFGALAGATSSAGYKGKPFTTMVNPEDRSRYAGGSLSRIEGWANGSRPVTSQATINRTLSGQRSRIASAAAAARARENERWIASGEGDASGSRGRHLAAIDRSQIDAERQLAGPILAQAAMAQPEFEMRAQGMMLPFLSQEESLAYGDHMRLEQLRAARKAQGSTLHRSFAGGAAGFGGAGGGGTTWGDAPMTQGGYAPPASNDWYYGGDNPDFWDPSGGGNVDGDQGIYDY